LAIEHCSAVKGSGFWDAISSSRSPSAASRTHVCVVA
jgi:hypothetical protein